MSRLCWVIVGLLLFLVVCEVIAGVVGCEINVVLDGV